MMDTRTPGVKFPEIVVPLTGQDGNAFGILGKVRRSLKRHGLDDDTVREFIDEATAGDYSHLLRTVTRWVSVA